MFTLTFLLGLAILLAVPSIGRTEVSTLKRGSEQCNRDLLIIAGKTGEIRIEKEGTATVLVNDGHVGWKCQQGGSSDSHVTECPDLTNQFLAHRQLRDNAQWLYECQRNY
jgi:hypothetical protein